MASNLVPFPEYLKKNKKYKLPADACYSIVNAVLIYPHDLRTGILQLFAKSLE